MNLSLSKLPWYGQLGAFAALSLAGAGIFWNFYAKPVQETITAREAQLERLRPVLPSEKDVADLLRRIQGMATQSNLVIRGFSPQAVATRQLYAEWPIGLQIEGTYHNLGSFLERVSKFPRIINVNGIHIKARDGGTPNDSITAECTATTFVLVEAKKPATTAAAATAAPKTE